MRHTNCKLKKDCFSLITVHPKWRVSCVACTRDASFTYAHHISDWRAIYFFGATSSLVNLGCSCDRVGKKKAPNPIGKAAQPGDIRAPVLRSGAWSCTPTRRQSKRPMPEQTRPRDGVTTASAGFRLRWRRSGTYVFSFFFSFLLHFFFFLSFPFLHFYKNINGCCPIKIYVFKTSIFFIENSMTHDLHVPLDFVVHVDINPETKAWNSKYSSPYPFSSKPVTQIILADNEIKYSILI